MRPAHAVCIRSMEGWSGGSVSRLFQRVVFEQLGDDLVEAPSRIGRVELAVLGHHEDGGDGFDPPRAGKVALPALPLVILGPRDLVTGHEVLELVEAPLIFGLVEADADEL